MDTTRFANARYAALTMLSVTVIPAIMAGLAGCAGGHAEALAPPATPAPSMARYVSEHYDIVFDYPMQVEAKQRFESDYFLGNRWNPDMAANIPGAALLALTLPESNEITRATLRLGASDDSRAVDACQSTPGAEDAETVRLRGVGFTRRNQSDAAMNHYSHVRSYRGVHDGQCVAIDLIVTGTEPGVYGGDPPPEPPFTAKAAMKRLEALLDGLTFAVAS